MFAPAHMAIGALAEKGLKQRAPTAAIALLSHPIVDNPRLWHAPYPWPSGSPAILQFLPYPHDLPSILTLVALVVLTIGVAILLRHYWWGMLWAVSPDIIDWLILRPTIGRTPIMTFSPAFPRLGDLRLRWRSSLLLFTE